MLTKSRSRLQRQKTKQKAAQVLSHFTEHLADVFDEPPREHNYDLDNSSFLIQELKNNTGSSTYNNPDKI
jgi:hypothetical protein